jgi:hypothetical protein
VNGRVRIERHGRVETIDLTEYGAGSIAEAALTASHAWIKALRHLEVDGRRLRDRFTYRGDSLWWFAELFLHKEGVVTALWHAALTLEALCTREEPAALGAADANPVLALLVPQVAARHGLRTLPSIVRPRTRPRLDTGVRSRVYTWAARGSRVWPGQDAPELQRRGTLAFVHSAFWRAGTEGEGSAGEEGYIGPVLAALAETGAAPVQLVGVGPRRNFRARRWWHPLLPSWRRPTGPAIVPVERLSSRADLAGSDAVWDGRDASAAALTGSEPIREASRIGGLDAWPMIRDAMRGIAMLQFPWSARAMDEAAAAMAACRPRLVLTYAEAGGWGRAIMLEARRQGVPSAGLQHGFIYRHWLNYRHEPDEMLPSPGNAEDRGFPVPSRTLLYDGFAERHLREAGAFPPEALLVTGSPGLDRLAAVVRGVTPEERVRLRAAVGPEDARLVLLVAKRSQLGPWLDALVAAVDALDGVRLLMKPHPAETADPYEAAAARGRRAGLAPGSLDLGRLLAIVDLVVTVNSTVAIDAAVLGIPAITVGLPNNLSPFVEMKVMAGVAEPAALAGCLGDLLSDDRARDALLAGARAYAEQYRVRADGRSADRAAAALAGLAAPADRAAAAHDPL